MSASQGCVSFNQAHQIFARLNRTDGQNVVALYPVSMSHSLKFLIMRDRTKMRGRSEWNRSDFVGIDAVSIDHVTARVFGKRQNLRCATGGMPHGQAQLRSAATIESLRQVLERKIVNAHNDGTRTKRRRSELYVQHVYWMFAKFGAESQWNSD